MFGRHSAQVVQSGRSFLSSLVLGVSLVLVSLVCAATLITVYGLNIVDRKTGNIFEFAEATVQSLPDLVDSLPPILADVVDDQRRPDYANQLDVSVRLTDARGSGRVRPVVAVHNRGSEVVSLMSMRIIVLNDRDDLITEINEWAATPIAADHHWRGPLLPGASRHFAAGSRSVGKNFRSDDDLRVEFEITDVRVWNRDSAGPGTPANTTS